MKLFFKVLTLRQVRVWVVFFFPLFFLSSAPLAHILHYD